MADIKDMIKLAVDGYKGSVEKYSVKQSQEVLRQALIEANNGSSTLDIRAIRDGKCNGLFSIVEELLKATVVANIEADAAFNALVDFRNVAEGDKNEFVVQDSTLFIVAEAADGTQGIRRQRLGGAKEVQIPTTVKAVRIYEELTRVLSGKIDFNEMVDRVAESFKQKLMNDAYGLWNSATADQIGGVTYFPVGGSYNEDAILDLISHVEAAAGGRTATIIGTKKAIRKLKASIMSDSAKEDLYNMGYYGNFYGTPVVVTPQRHKVGTTNFVMDDDSITIIAGDDKPIKVVYEGEPLVIMGDPLKNADLTQEYFYAEKYGMGIVLAGGNAGIGRYKMA